MLLYKGNSIFYSLPFLDINKTFFFPFCSHCKMPTMPCCSFHLLLKYKWNHTCNLSWNTTFPFYIGKHQINHLWLLFFLTFQSSCNQTCPDFCGLLFSTENSSANNKNTFKQSIRVLYILLTAFLLYFYCFDGAT